MADSKDQKQEDVKVFKKTRKISLILNENKMINGKTFKKGDAVFIGECVGDLGSDDINRGLQIKQFTAVQSE